MDAQFFVDLILFLIYAGIVFLLLAYIWRFWMLFINQKYMNGVDKGTIMLEIKLPREIFKSPEAMENVIASMFQTGGVGSYYKRNYKGGLPAYFSLEIASIEGVIHFYIRAEKKFQSLLESELYAQYPGIEVITSDDYTKLVPAYKHNSKDVSAWGITYGTTGSFIPIDEKTGNPYKKGGKDYKITADILPLKTYVDYKLDKDPKEEYKNDPLTPLLEFMGQMGKGEYVWYQVMVQDESVFNGKKYGEAGKKFPKTFVNEITGDRFTLKDLAEARKKQIRKYKKIKKGDLAYDAQGHPVQKTVRKEDGSVTIEPVTYADERETIAREAELTAEEKDEIEAINKKLGKPTGRAIIRLMYVTDNKKNPKAFRGEAIQQILTILKPFNGQNSLNIRKITDPYDNPWQNLGGKRTAWRTEEMFESYVERDGFSPFIKLRDEKEGKMEDTIFQNIDMKYRKIYRLILETLLSPFSRPEAIYVSVLNTEELATLYHFPGQVASVPTLPRIDSTKSTAPMNLPLE